MNHSGAREKGSKKKKKKKIAHGKSRVGNGERMGKPVLEVSWFCYYRGCYSVLNGKKSPKIKVRATSSLLFIFPGS